VDLSAKQLADILTSLRSGAGSGRAKGSEKRSQPRIGVRYRTTIRPLVAAGLSLAPVRAFVRDVSAVGVGLSVPMRLTPGNSLIILLPRAVGGPLELACLVRACVSVGKDLHQVGVTFVQSLDDIIAA
jgi:hypothetical protein